MLANFFPNLDMQTLLPAIGETLYMTGVAAVATFLLGLILGSLLFLTSKGQMWENNVIHTICAAYVNTFRSIPFFILIILLIPFTTLLIGTMLGASAALPALIIGAAPFYARMVEIALREIDKGVIEASVAMGADTFTIIFKVLIPEALPALISGITVTSISLVSFTAMAGAIGAGGLGSLAYYDGFQRGQNDVTVIATICIILIVFMIQFVGDAITKKIDKR